MPNELPLLISDRVLCVRSGNHSYLCEISAKLNCQISSVEFGAAVILTLIVLSLTSSPVCNPYLSYVEGDQTRSNFSLWTGLFCKDVL